MPRFQIPQFARAFGEVARCIDNFLLQIRILEAIGHHTGLDILHTDNHFSRRFPTVTNGRLAEASFLHGSEDPKVFPGSRLLIFGCSISHVPISSLRKFLARRAIPFIRHARRYRRSRSLHGRGTGSIRLWLQFRSPPWIILLRHFLVRNRGQAESAPFTTLTH